MGELAGTGGGGSGDDVPARVMAASWAQTLATAVVGPTLEAA